MVSSYNLKIMLPSTRVLKFGSLRQAFDAFKTSNSTQYLKKVLKKINLILEANHEYKYKMCRLAWF